ncbi:MAG: Rieske 2Fe-2S domain-containing protein [Alphaproteobacteria bacterium]
MARSPIVVDRRYVLGTSAALVGAAFIPSVAQAQRGSEPSGQLAALELDDNNAVDVQVLQPGEMIVVATAGTYYGILRRTIEQIEAAQGTDAVRVPVKDADRVKDDNYLVADLACPHRGCQVGYTNKPDMPFLCPCHRSSFDASGRVLGGASRSNLAIPNYEINGSVVVFS